MKQDKPLNVAEGPQHSGHAEAGALSAEDLEVIRWQHPDDDAASVLHALVAIDDDCGLTVDSYPQAFALHDALLRARAILCAPAPTKESAAAGCATLPDSAASTETGR